MAQKSDVKATAFKVIQYILLLLAGIGLCWMFFRNVNFAELNQRISTGNFSWFFIVMLVSLAVYVIRTLRWQMLIRAMGHETKFYNAFAALSISYFVSFIIPRLGEVTRCLSVKKQHNIPFMKLLGTVIVERIADVISLIFMLLLTLVLQFGKIMEFMRVYVFRPFYEGIVLKVIHGNMLLKLIAGLIVVLMIVCFIYFRKRLRDRSPQLIDKFVSGLKDGLLSVMKLENKGLFILYTFLIWLGYYLMTWFWFFIFPETSVLTWGACLSIVTIGTIGRSVPIQGGGMGAYHFLVTNVVILYGLSASWGQTLSTLIHLGQTFFTCVMGLTGLLIFFLVYWKRK
ncbi:MAG: flippase-like domain-containing protein [Bacteroidota bacterium]|nr:flippase-like domain-containing protein [Bacteroidota bacterium]